MFAIYNMYLLNVCTGSGVFIKKVVVKEMIVDTEETPPEEEEKQEEQEQNEEEKKPKMTVKREKEFSVNRYGLISL